jgi:hypothetical protein
MLRFLPKEMYNCFRINSESENTASLRNIGKPRKKEVNTMLYLNYIIKIYH